jgi:hypothetical protein
MLVVHLKRFSYGSYTRSKLNTDVKFPTTLTLAEFAPKESKEDSNPWYIIDDAIVVFISSLICLWYDKIVMSYMPSPIIQAV